MRILLLNPNTTEALTAQMAAIARKVVPPGVEIEPLTAPRGFPYISSQAESQISSMIVCEMLAERAADADGAIIAAFGDPGLAGAKQLFDFPVVGMAEAAILSATMLGARFSIVTFSPVMRRWYTDAVRDAGMMDRFTGVRAPTEHSAAFDGMQERMRSELAALCNAAVHEDGADVVILGGAPLAGLAATIADDIDALVVDPITAATTQLCALISTVDKRGYDRRVNRPVRKPTSGLAGALQRCFAEDPAR